jgi:uncharacterized lipoprotein YehR (DUF1307 family)
LLWVLKITGCNGAGKEKTRKTTLQEENKFCHLRGFNNKIKRLKRMAYGYKDIDYFRLKIHQHCGLLNPRLNAINAT